MKKIDKYLSSLREGYEYDGVWYEDEENLLVSGFCNFCGCGRPEESLDYVYKALQHVQNLQDKVWKNLDTYDNWSKQEKKLFPIKGSAYFMYYWLDNMEFTEHGGSVPGWLTSKGKELLELIEEYYKN